jgi:hypothetical protein
MKTRLPVGLVIAYAAFQKTPQAKSENNSVIEPGCFVQHGRII